MKKKLSARTVVFAFMTVLFIGVLYMNNGMTASAATTDSKYTTLFNNQVNITATEPTDATAAVIEHVETDSKGNQISENDENGKEFYTIQTDTEKVFYLIIDRKSGEEIVYFLTEISEADLLNVTTDSSETYQENSSVLESAIQDDNIAVPNDEENVPLSEDEEGTETELLETEEQEEVNPITTYIFYGVAAVLAVGVGYYLKVYRKKGEDFVDDDEDEEDESEEVYENEDEETEDDFFSQNNEEEE